MRRYTKTEISERELEDIVGLSPGMIEEGLVYVDHQKQAAGGRLDVFLVDSGNALVVAELKIVQDDAMLLQALDYYDYVATNIERYTRLYSKFKIDPNQPPRLLLIAPSFSQVLMNRARWLDLPLSIFTYSCVRFDGDGEVVAVFSEQERESKNPVSMDDVYSLDDHLSYITDLQLRSQVVSLINEVQVWTIGNVSVDPIKHSLSFKVNGHVFAYLHVRRKHYLISTYDAEDNFRDYPVKAEIDLEPVKHILMDAVRRYAN